MVMHIALSSVFLPSALSGISSDMAGACVSNGRNQFVISPKNGKFLSCENVLMYMSAPSNCHFAISSILSFISSFSIHLAHSGFLSSSCSISLRMSMLNFSLFNLGFFIMAGIISSRILRSIFCVSRQRSNCICIVCRRFVHELFSCKAESAAFISL